MGSYSVVRMGSSEGERYERRDTIQMLFVNMYMAKCCGGNVAEASGRSKAGGETIDV